MFWFTTKLALFLLCFLHGFDCGRVFLNKFNCDFKDEDYFLKVMNLNPSFGRAVDNTPIEFKTERQFKTFLSEVTRIYHEVLTKNNYNNIDGFLEYHDDYSKASSESTTQAFKFYYEYRYKFRPRETGVGLAIELLDRIQALKDQYPQVADKGFIASSPIGLKETECKLLQSGKSNQKLGFSNVHLRRIINAVAALKLQVEFKTVFVILHAEYYLTQPIVVVQDKPNDSLNKLTAYSQGRKFSYKMFPNNKDYLLVQRYAPDDESRIEDYEMVYLGAGYCSAMETTDKRDRISTHKSLAKRKDGQVLAEITVDVYEMLDCDKRVIKTYLYSETDRKNVEMKLQIPEGDFISSLGADEQNRVQELAQAFGMTEDDLKEKLNKLKQVVLDESFVKTILDINKVLAEADPGKIQEAVLGEKAM